MITAAAPAPSAAPAAGHLDYTQLMANLIGSVKAPAPTGPASQQSDPFAQSMAQANQANAQRGQAILSLLQGQGTAQMQRNQQGYQNQLGQIQQSMMSKGLANTSVGNSLDQGALNQLNLSDQGVSEQAAMAMAQMANSFSQQGPNMNLIAQLMQGLGRGAAANGGLNFGQTFGNPAMAAMDATPQASNSLANPAATAYAMGGFGGNPTPFAPPASGGDQTSSPSVSALLQLLGGSGGYGSITTDQGGTSGVGSQGFGVDDLSQMLAGMA